MISFTFFIHLEIESHIELFGVLTVMIKDIAIKKMQVSMWTWFSAYLGEYEGAIVISYKN